MKKLITTTLFIILINVSKSQTLFSETNSLSIDSISKVTNIDVLGYSVYISKNEENNTFERLIKYFYKQNDVLVYDYLGGVENYPRGRFFLDSLSTANHKNIYGYKKTFYTPYSRKGLIENSSNIILDTLQDEIVFFDYKGNKVYDFLSKSYDDSDVIDVIAKYRN